MEQQKRNPDQYTALDLSHEAERLLEECAAVNIAIDGDQALRLIAYLQLVLVKNCALNLTSIRDWDKALTLHLVDSLTFLPEFDDQPDHIAEMPFLDMGCGAGFPGIPLAIVRPLRIGELCDSVRKKIVAVDEFVAALDLERQLSTNSERVENYAKYRKHDFGCVTARAVASLPVLLEYAAPFVPRDGRLIVSKGQPTPDELESGAKVAKVCGFKVYSKRTVELPRDMGQRTLISYVKIKEPAFKLPRAIGMAQKDPLG